MLYQLEVGNNKINCTFTLHQTIR